MRMLSVEEQQNQTGNRNKKESIFAVIGGIVFFRLFGVIGVLLFAMAAGAIKKIRSTNLPVLIKIVFSISAIGISVILYFLIALIMQAAFS